jgi:Amt family ammonium transporter
MIGGCIGLVGAICLGARIGRFESKSIRYTDPADGVAKEAKADNIHLREYNSSFDIAGVMLVLMGFMMISAFDPLGLKEDQAIYNTLVGAAAGAFICFIICSIINSPMVDYHKQVLNGALAGAIAVSGSPSNYYTWESMIIAFIGGALYFLFSRLIFPKCRVDDPLDGISYHFICGLWGTIAVGLFHKE